MPNDSELRQSATRAGPPDSPAPRPPRGDASRPDPAGREAIAADLGMLLLRVVAGLSLALAHGLGKVPPSARLVGWVGSMGMPAPELAAWLSATAEFGGGILLALGLLTRPAALLICGNMLVVTLVAHAGDPFGDREKAILFGAIALLYLLAGAGRYSLDALIRRRTS